MDAKRIKERLLEDENIEKVLDSLGCEYVKREQRGSLVTAQLPDKFGSNNKRAVQVYAMDGLPSKIRNVSNFKGDIFSLVSFIKFDSDTSELQSTFKQALKHITDLFGWSSSSGKSSRKKDYVAPLKALASKSKSYTERVPNKPISESVLDNFRWIADAGWYKEGISLQTQMFYNIGFDYQTHRITIPIRNENGELVGVKGRLINNEDKTDFNPKYTYLYKCNISQEWFNMYVARTEILKKKKVYIFESEKSVMKLHSHGITNTLAISSSDISEVQTKMIKNLGLDIDIVLCYDKDKSVDDVRKTADMFTNRDVYSILDLDNLLGEKDSPIDKGIEVWNKLNKNNLYPVNIVKK